MLPGQRVITHVRLNDADEPEDVAPELATLDEVKAFLEIDAADVSEDEFLTDSIRAASLALERYCDRFLARTKVIETVVSHPCGALVLTHQPLAQIFDVKGDDGTIDPLHFIVDANAAMLIPRKNWREVFAADEIEATYITGYKRVAVPAVLKRAVFEYVKSLRYDRDRDPGVASERGEDVGQVDYVWGISSAAAAQSLATGAHGGAVPTTAAAIINTYRRRV